MHTATTAKETLEILWNNYLTLCEQVDLDAKPPGTLDALKDSPFRPFRIASWLVRQGYFIAAWALWEYYSRTLCQSLANKERKAGHESSVDWVGRSLASNGMDFGDQDWFSSANSLRNLIAHCGARAVGSRAATLLERSRTAFPDIETWQDGYVAITHSHLSDLQIKIRHFIHNTACQSGAPERENSGGLASLGNVNSPPGDPERSG